jgi:hypothetical protein
MVELRLRDRRREVREPREFGDEREVTASRTEAELDRVRGDLEWLERARQYAPLTGQASALYEYLIASEAVLLLAHRSGGESDRQ